MWGAKKLVALALSVATASSTTAAFSDRLYCELSDAYSLGDDGTLKDSEIRDELLKSQVVVDRATGAIMHPFFGSEFYQTVQVVDLGSSGSSFKVIAISTEGSPVKPGEAPFRNTLVLQVGVYAQTEEKPFLLLADTTLVVGRCQ